MNSNARNFRKTGINYYLSQFVYYFLANYNNSPFFFEFNFSRLQETSFFNLILNFSQHIFLYFLLVLNL